MAEEHCQNLHTNHPLPPPPPKKKKEKKRKKERKRKPYNSQLFK